MPVSTWIPSINAKGVSKSFVSIANELRTIENEMDLLNLMPDTFDFMDKDFEEFGKAVGEEEDAEEDLEEEDEDGDGDSGKVEFVAWAIKEEKAAEASSILTPATDPPPFWVLRCGNVVSTAPSAAIASPRDFPLLNNISVCPSLFPFVPRPYFLFLCLVRSLCFVAPELSPEDRRSSRGAVPPLCLKPYEMFLGGQAGSGS